MVRRFAALVVVGCAAWSPVAPPPPRRLGRATVVASPVEEPATWTAGESLQARLLRWSVIAAVPACVVWHQALDAAVARLWATVYAWPLAHHCMFEALTATFGFVAAIAFWSSAHVVLWPQKHRRGRNIERFRLDGHAPVAPFEWLGDLGVKRFVGAWLPLVAYLGSIAIFHVFVTKPPLPLEPPTFARFLVEVVCGVVLYDLLFWPIHASFHRPSSPRWWRRLHHTHHHARPEARRGHSLVPLETVQHSYPDGFLQVAINVLVQRARIFTPAFLAAPLAKHPLSRVTHNLVVTYLLAESHSGYDLPFMSHRVFPTVFGGSVAHDAHHLNGASNHRQFFRRPALPGRQARGDDHHAAAAALVVQDCDGDLPCVLNATRSARAAARHRTLTSIIHAA